MRYLLLCLLPLCYLNCSSPTMAGRTPAVPTAPTAADLPTIIIGYTGGWGGGPAYKVENGKVYKSTKARALGMPADILATDYATYSGAGTNALRQLAADFQPTTMAAFNPSFDCPEAASDRTCPYFIVVDNGQATAWTKSQQSGSNGPAFNGWMERVVAALGRLE